MSGGNARPMGLLRTIVFRAVNVEAGVVEVTVPLGHECRHIVRGARALVAGREAVVAEAKRLAAEREGGTS